MRWMYARQRPEDNILFGYDAANEARRELLVLWNVVSFLVTYARLADWTPDATRAVGGTPGLASGASALDRWIISRAAALAAEGRVSMADFDVRAATVSVSGFIDDLSQWYLRRSRRRLSRNDDVTDRESAFETLHLALVVLTQVIAPILPFLAEELYQALITEVAPDDDHADAASLPDSVHLTHWPDEELAPLREPSLEAAMVDLRRAVDLGRTLRSNAGIKIRQPLAQLWLALPGGHLRGDLGAADEAALLELLADDLNIRTVTLIGDGSDLVERRVKVLLPVLGQRGKGALIPAVMAAARADQVEYLSDGGVRLAGHELAVDEVEIQATPRPGTAVAADDGIVVVIDTILTDDLRAEGDARELTRALQDLRRQAELSLDATIEVWLDTHPSVIARLEPHLAVIGADVLAEKVHRNAAPGGVPVQEVPLDGGTARIGLRETSGAGMPR